MKRALTGIGLAVGLFTVSALGTPSFATTNLLANPGFESGYDGWFTFGAGVQLSTPADDDIIRSGMVASKVFGEFTGCPGAPQFDVGGYGQLFTPTAGANYEFSGYSFVSSGDPIPGTDQCNSNRLIAKIVYFDAAAGGAEISSNEIIIGGIDTVLDQWNHFTVSAPVPAGAARVEALILYLQPACDTGAVYVDDLSFCEFATPAAPNLLVNPSFDTSLIGWTVFGNAFHDGRNFLVRTPTGSAKLFSSFAVGSDSGMFQSFAAAPGSEWELDLYTLNNCREDPITGTNDNLLLAKIVFRDSGGLEIGAAEAVVADASSPLGTWTYGRVVAQAPANTVTVDSFLLFVSPSLLGGAFWVDDVGFRQLILTDAPVVAGVPDFELRQNVPNPFGPSTRIEFVLRRADAVDVSVYDVAGRRVATLLQGATASGSHQLTWDGRDEGGALVASGIYRYVLRTSEGTTSRSMMLLR